ncbi:nicolin-1-like isoform X2 [Xenia sp. Carnegie-2017]|uniref:nicolin-1-like isoform X2 n=1 Tax=Xenia sp. Carnegie-2017 TaxID=2897299 RepID=UPI001F03432C|nr:nicolin-1-like isoform X2 [Xenia sp. Carnegie-2017]
MENVEREDFLEYTLKKPIFLRVGSPTVEFKSGCCVRDVLFLQEQPVEIGYFSFQNNYTASISVKYKSSDGSWKVCLKNHILMPSAHCEEGSQSVFTVKSDMMLCPIRKANMVRLLLRQPSPHWLDFSIEDLRFYPPRKVSSCLANVLASNVEDISVDDDKIDGCYDLNLLSYT